MGEKLVEVLYVSYVCVRFMYFPVRSSGRGRIDRCNMDGTNCLTLINVNTSWPSGLTVDFEGELYSTCYIGSAASHLVLLVLFFLINRLSRFHFAARASSIIPSLLLKLLVLQILSTTKC